jgi:hypothetical protein
MLQLLQLPHSALQEYGTAAAQLMHADVHIDGLHCISCHLSLRQMLLLTAQK